MYRTDSVIDIGPLKQQTYKIRHAPRQALNRAEAAIRRHESDILDDLSHTPGRVKYPIDWTSERQRRAFFATNGFGHGIPYKRSGRMNEGWQIIILRGKDFIEMRIINRVPYTQFVVGRLRPRGKNPMQRFHLNTGWLPVVEAATRGVALVRHESLVAARDLF